jgi:hypothetical protein
MTLGNFTSSESEHSLLIYWKKLSRSLGFQETSDQAHKLIHVSGVYKDHSYRIELIANGFFESGGCWNCIKYWIDTNRKVSDKILEKEVSIYLRKNPSLTNKCKDDFQSGDVCYHEKGIKIISNNVYLYGANIPSGLD